MPPTTRCSSANYSGETKARAARYYWDGKAQWGLVGWNAYVVDVNRVGRVEAEGQSSMRLAAAVKAAVGRSVRKRSGGHDASGAVGEDAKTKGALAEHGGTSGESMV